MDDKILKEIFEQFLNSNDQDIITQLLTAIEEILVENNNIDQGMVSKVMISAIFDSNEFIKRNGILIRQKLEVADK